ncbi:MAG TPA: dTDP-4-dehydrorhamnose 3,5-epimerase [Pseudolabrys sp.]|nr:dTDP-4-dehydrorhamnose 3,5-epimerase [Pseudolabrys sp.]
MRFDAAPLLGAFVIGLEPRIDQRGAFARVFCAREFAALNLETTFVQANIAISKLPATVRGMHYQRAPYSEVKLVRCVRGSIFDVIVDLRRESPTYLKWFGMELSEENALAMYVPKGFAHGYESLSENASVHYMVNEYYAPDAEKGCRYDDPALAINWPLAVGNVSEKDTKWPLLAVQI